jgi:hypothetical protein
MLRSKSEFIRHIILNIASVLPLLPRGVEQVGDAA